MKKIISKVIIYLKSIPQKIKTHTTWLYKKLKEIITNDEKKKEFKVKFRKVLFGMKTTDGAIYRTFIYLLLIVLGFIFVFPIISMIITSLKCVADLADTSVKWIPSVLEFNNYKVAFEELDFLNSFLKTLVVAFVPSIINVIICCLTAYGFSKFKFPGKNILFAIMLATFIIPRKLINIPQYAWYSQIKLLGSLLTYILPSTFGQGLNSSLYILILYSTLNLIPKQLEESARLDGANNIQIFFKIVLPLIIPGLITVFLFSFVWYWNDSSTASLYLSQQGSGSWKTLLVMLSSYQDKINSITNGGVGIQAVLYQGTRMAATLLSILPLLLLYFSLQKYFVESVEKSGITGE